MRGNCKLYEHTVLSERLRALLFTVCHQERRGAHNPPFEFFDPLVLQMLMLGFADGAKVFHHHSARWQRATCRRGSAAPVPPSGHPLAVNSNRLGDSPRH